MNKAFTANINDQVTARGYLAVYGDTAETWAGTTHTVKIEEMGY